MTQERLTALEDVAALATIGATYAELMLYLQTEITKCEQTALAQPEQEPVAWMVKLGDVTCFQHHADSKYASVPLYTTPPASQRPWVGLTASTILNLMPSSIPADHDGALMEFARAIEAKLKERNRGATTHCQCAACKNGNIHDSDCSVHNGDALPVGPCDCSLATPPVQPAQTFYQPAANEAVEILKSLGYVYEPTYTGLAWVAKKSAQPEQRKPLTDDVLVPLEILEAAANSLDSFCGNLGWGDADLQTLDNLFAVIEQHKAAHNIKEGT